MPPKITIAPIKIRRTLPEDYPAFWEILKNWGNFWIDEAPVKDLPTFTAWYKRKALDSLTGLSEGRVVGGAYLDDIIPGHKAHVNIFKRRGYLNPRLVAAVVRQALPYWFQKFNLEVMIGYTRHRAAVRLAKRLGFKKTGVLPYWARVDGRLVDYTILALRRDQVKWTLKA